MINIVLYKPDIPQNTAAIVRLGACLNLKIHIIEPCGFNLDDSRFKRVVMDYMKLGKITRYENFQDFKKKNFKARIVLMTTKAKKSYHKFKFKKNDIFIKELKFFISKVKSKTMISSSLNLYNGIKTLRFALKMKKNSNT